MKGLPFNVRATAKADKIILTGQCLITGKLIKIEVGVEDFHRWQEGSPVQEVFPNLDPAEREFLVSGMTQVAEGELFGEEAEL